MSVIPFPTKQKPVPVEYAEKYFTESYSKADLAEVNRIATKALSLGWEKPELFNDKTPINHGCLGLLAILDGRAVLDIQSKRIVIQNHKPTFPDMVFPRWNRSKWALYERLQTILSNDKKEIN